MGKRERITVIVLMSAVLLLGAFMFVSYAADIAAAEEKRCDNAAYEENTEAVAIENEVAAQQAQLTQAEPESIYGRYIIQGPVYAITDEERELIEKVVAAEARGESIECMMAVAQTIRDRCITREQTVTEVLTAQNQFAMPYEGEITDRLSDAVRFTFDEGISTFEYPTTHFYASHLIEPPDWTYEMEFLGEIDGVSFYRE